MFGRGSVSFQSRSLLSTYTGRPRLSLPINARISFFFFGRQALAGVFLFLANLPLFLCTVRSLGRLCLGAFRTDQRRVIRIFCNSQRHNRKSMSRSSSCSWHIFFCLRPWLRYLLTAAHTAVFFPVLLLGFFPTTSRTPAPFSSVSLGATKLRS